MRLDYDNLLENRVNTWLWTYRDTTTKETVFLWIR
jgi:hypothetical protein